LNVYIWAYIFKAILAEQCEYMQKAENREPGAPQHYLFHLLSIHYAENEDELVEHKVPELVFHMLQIAATTNNHSIIICRSVKPLISLTALIAVLTHILFVTFFSLFVFHLQVDVEKSTTAVFCVMFPLKFLTVLIFFNPD